MGKTWAKHGQNVGTTWTKHGQNVAKRAQHVVNTWDKRGNTRSFGIVFKGEKNNSRQISRSAHQTPNSMNSEFNFPNLRCCKVFFFLFNIKSCFGIFGCILILI